MALLTEQEVRTAAGVAARRTFKATASILRESRDTSRSSFDVFLSHSRLDSDVIVGVKEILEATGLSVYIDWIDDPLLDRSHVTPATAHKLRLRMRQSKSLFYVHSENATASRWMPWELGFFDGHNGNVAILPVVRNAGQTAFKGEEFLGLYPYVDLTGRSIINPGSIQIRRNMFESTSFSRWRDLSDKMQPAT